MQPPSHRRADVPLDPWSHLRVALACGGVLAFLYGASRDPAWVETVWLPRLGAPATAWTAWLTGWVPLTLAEIVAGVLIVLVVLRTLAAASDVVAGRRGVGNAIGEGVLTALSAGVLALAWFHVVWGTAYARAPIGARMGLDVASVTLSGEADLAGLEARLASVVDRVNAAYIGLHGAADPGEVTVPRAGLDVDAALERAFAGLAGRVDLGGDFGARRPPAKVPETSVVLSWLGIAGVYVPFTGEALVNGQPPAWSQVMTRAHEKAHQRFIAAEDEATFVGALAGIGSDEPLLRYAAWQTVRRQLLFTLASADPERAMRQHARLAPGPLRDAEAVRDHWAGFEGPLEDVQRQVNDTYLRANGVEDGVAAYGRAATLFDAWLRTPAGRAALSGRSTTSP